MFRVTNDIYVGRFASRERLDKLRNLKITDILNVSDTASQLTTADGPFRSVSWFDIEDRVLIPIATAINAIDVIHRSLIADSGRIYVHCMAGWNRSPTIIWLYLLACGIPSGEATRLICAQAFDAVPGHSLLVDSTLTETVQAHGLANYLPHRRPSTIAAT